MIGSSAGFVWSIGLSTLAYTTYRLSKFIYLYFLKSTTLKRYTHKLGSWALVTGASDGIGYAIAEELAGKGFNIILHGRNTEKLNMVKDQLEQSCPDIKIRIFIADVTKDSIKPITDFVAEIQGLPLTVLINNVGGTKGFLSSDFKTFEDTSPEEIDNLVKANIRFTTILTNALLPTLVKQSSLILNVGSTSFTGFPYLGVYSATKAYIATWSFALSIEMQAEGHDVEVLGVLSGNTQSGQNRTPTSLFNPSSKTLAQAALQKVGSGKTIVTAYWPHEIQRAFVSWLPEWALRSVVIMALEPLKNKGLKDWVVKE